MGSGDRRLSVDPGESGDHQFQTILETRTRDGMLTRSLTVQVTRTGTGPGAGA